MEKIKSFLESSGGKDILVVFIVILVGLSSFGLGRLSKNNSSGELKVLYPGQSANTINTTVQTTSNSNTPQENLTKSSTNLPAVASSVGKSFFASSRGQKYYPVGCSAGKTIKQENRVYFSTKADAEKAGYELSSSCK